MVSRRRSLMSHGWWAGALLVAGSTLLPAAAQAQARGTLQVSAQVVDAKVSYDGLEVAKATLHQATSTSGVAQAGVTTLARVSVAYATEQRPTVVVTIDYSSN